MVETMPAGAPMTARRPVRQPRRRVLSYSSNAIAAFIAIFGLTFITPLGSKGALLFLLGGMALVATRPGEVLASLRREWPIVLVALWCVMSFAWSDYTSLTLRYGIQLVLTVIIAVAIGYRLAPMTFVKIVFATSAMGGLASLLLGRARSDGMGYLGIHASKNALADASSVLIIASLAVLVDRRLSMRWRLPALAAMFLGAVLLVMGQSSGALVSTMAVILVFGVIILLQRLTPYMRLVAIALAVVLGAAIAMLLSSLSDELARLFLDVTGKDITLTGRTDLWAVAFGQIAERPLLGVGFQAFWVPGQPLAEQLWADFGIAGRSGFNFHNTPISNAVEIGILATAAQALIFIAAAWACLGWAIRSPSAASVFFALFMVRLFMLMWIEVVYFYQFSAGTAIIIAAICYAHRFRDHIGKPVPRRARRPIRITFR
ncbi:O-antigen ligase family protein [Paracoccus marcusii]|uniref:O-antigen ligase family protein n=1 Tax=Paracoccus marcusii TaxID=59779 RepID=UPI002491D2D9|nr:O-antigen ligase family protein [Paracoccus marcusii]